MTREEAIRDIKECVMPYVGGISLQMAIDDMTEMDRLSKATPVLKEPERPHGEWVHGREISQMWTGDKLVGIDYEDFSCSCCGVVVEESTEPQWNFCPNCGADMRTEEGDPD